MKYKEQIKEILNSYSNEELIYLIKINSILQLSKKFNVHRRIIYKLMKILGIEKEKNKCSKLLFLQDLLNKKEEIINLYNQIRNIQELSNFLNKKYNLNSKYHHIDWLLRKWNIKKLRKSSWCKGLTKETDERIRKQSENLSKKRREMFQSGELKSINDYMFDEEKQQRNLKSQQTRIKKYGNAFGKSCWNKGLTKESDIRVAKYAKNISISRKGKSLSEKNKMNIKKSMQKSEKVQKHIKWLNGVFHKGRKRSIITCQKISNKLKGFKHSEKTKQKIKEARKRQIFTMKPNLIENKIIDLINKHNLPYKYVGNGSFKIENMNPDFINVNSLKVCIEVLGCYWHHCPIHCPDSKTPNFTEEDRKIRLKQYGWKLVSIWEHELKEQNWEQNVLKKIKAIEREYNLNHASI